MDLHTIELDVEKIAAEAGRDLAAVADFIAHNAEAVAGAAHYAVRDVVANSVAAPSPVEAAAAGVAAEAGATTTAMAEKIAAATGRDTAAVAAFISANLPRVADVVENAVADLVSAEVPTGAGTGAGSGGAA